MTISKFLIVAAGALGLVAAVPLQAQNTPIRADIVRDDIERLDDDIDRADREDIISEREAHDLRERLDSLRDQFRRLNANGLTRPEVRRLEDRINYIRSRLRMEKVDWGGRVG
jgi:hypothetical protein